MTKAVTKVDSKVPDYIKQGEARGNENVGTDDLVIPRLILLQKISPELDKNDALFIEGAEDGQFANSLTREVYNAPINIVPVFYRKEYVVFKDRKKGGGFRGMFANEELAKTFCADHEEGADLEITETGNHFCFIVKEDGSHEEISIPMTSTKLKVSRQINSLVRMRGGDRWAGCYALGSVSQKNDLGTFYNYSVVNNGWASKEVYEAGEKVYEQIKSGVKTADYGPEEDKPVDEGTEY